MVRADLESASPERQSVQAASAQLPAVLSASKRCGGRSWVPWWAINL